MLFKVFCFIHTLDLGLLVIHLQKPDLMQQAAWVQLAVVCYIQTCDLDAISICFAMICKNQTCD